MATVTVILALMGAVIFLCFANPWNAPQEPDESEEAVRAAAFVFPSKKVLRVFSFERSGSDQTTSCFVGNSLRHDVEVHLEGVLQDQEVGNNGAVAASSFVQVCNKT